MAQGQISGVGVASVAAGGLLIWAGITGKDIPRALQLIVQGKSPKGAPVSHPIGSGSGPLATSATLVTASKSALAADAMQYAGAGYVWGGAPGKGIGNWDCSSFVNWCAGHDLGLAIPGYQPGTYDGSSHGPTTQIWLLWPGLVTIGSDPAKAEPGDLCIWQTHMGVALGGGQMISALNTQLGTQQTTIAGGAPGAELLFVRRFKPAGTGGSVA